MTRTWYMVQYMVHRLTSERIPVEPIDFLGTMLEMDTAVQPILLVVYLSRRLCLVTTVVVVVAAAAAAE